MNEYFISKTNPGTVKYPLHQHPSWEIMYYLEGTGFLATENEGIDFKPGTIIIVPPKIMHGSVSVDGFTNISIGGDFNHLILFDRIIAQQDNLEKDGRRLAELIFKNRSANREYLSSLCNAYAHYLLQNTAYEKRINQIIGDLINEITRNFSNPDFNVTKLLNESGYAEDYIRAAFKNQTSLTPVDFLAKTRIDHAKKLFEIYGTNLSVTQIAEICGFDDPVYFSRRFKQFTGISPIKYRNQ